MISLKKPDTGEAATDSHASDAAFDAWAGPDAAAGDEPPRA